MTTISTSAILKQWVGLARHYRKSTRSDTSYAGEYEYLRKVMIRLDITGGFVVDIAASDGVSQSCTFGFFKNPAWAGLAVEMDPLKFSKLAFLYAGFHCFPE